MKNNSGQDMSGRSLGEMLQLLASKPIQYPPAVDMEGAEAKVVSLRPDAELRYFLEQKAEQLGGMSLHALVMSMLKAYQLAEPTEEHGIANYYSNAVATIAYRVRYLFEFYEYTLIEAVAALGEFGVTPSIFLDDSKLLDCLTNEAFEELSQAFFVEKSWLMDPRIERMREVDTLRHESFDILREILEFSESNSLERIIPFCRSNDLQGDELLYSEENTSDTIYVGLAVMCRPFKKYKHSRFKILGTTSFNYQPARLEYKALLFELYRRFQGGGRFNGRRLNDHEFELITGHTSQPLHRRFLDAPPYWDAEHYVGATWKSEQGLEPHELEMVKAFADKHFEKLARETGNAP